MKVFIERDGRSRSIKISRKSRARDGGEMKWPKTKAELISHKIQIWNGQSWTEDVVKRHQTTVIVMAAVNWLPQVMHTSYKSILCLVSSWLCKRLHLMHNKKGLKGEQRVAATPCSRDFRCSVLPVRVGLNSYKNITVNGSELMRVGVAKVEPAKARAGDWGDWGGLRKAYTSSSNLTFYCFMR